MLLTNHDSHVEDDEYDDDDDDFDNTNDEEMDDATLLTWLRVIHQTCSAQITMCPMCG